MLGKLETGTERKSTHVNVTVNFNINTVDARGFNELLVNSRGTIVNLINSAMNEKGKMAIV